MSELTLNNQNNPVNGKAVSDDDCEQWSETLGLVSESLMMLAKESETEFLNVGSSLQTISAKAETIAGNTLSAATFLSGSEISGSIEELQDILENIDRYFHYCDTETEQDIGVLSSIQKEISRIGNPLHGFLSLVKRLGILAMSTRIENARLNSDNNKFENLVHDVANLSEVIGEKIKNIEKGVNALSILSGKRLGSIVLLKEQQYSQSAAIIQNLQNCLSSLSETHALSSDTTQNISAISGEIPGKINKIILSLQSHDIIRQKIEHVAQSIDAARELVASLTRLDTADRSRKVQQINSILNLQFDQLNQAGKEISHSIQDIIHNLNEIVHGISGMADEARSLISSSSDEDHHNMIQMVQRGIENVTASLFANVKANAELAEEMKSVGRHVREMEGFVEEINYVGTEIELISLNGLIHAAHLGQEGAGLSVLADAIQKLSVEAGTHIEAVSVILHQIVFSTGSKRFEAESDESMAGVEQVVQEMVGELGGFVDSLNCVSGKVEERLSQVHELATPFADEIEAHIQNITVHELFQQAISESTFFLKSVLENLTPFVTDISNDEIQAHLKGLEDQYTMNSERELHESYVLGESQPVSSETVSVLTDLKENDLGDNVELF